jgi:hypothetical protein
MRRGQKPKDGGFRDVAALANGKGYGNFAHRQLRLVQRQRNDLAAHLLADTGSRRAAGQGLRSSSPSRPPAA